MLPLNPNASAILPQTIENTASLTVLRTFTIHFFSIS